MQPSALAWFMTQTERSAALSSDRRGFTPRQRPSRRRGRSLLTFGVVLTCLAVPAAAEAAPLSLDQARQHAAAATAPLAVDGIVCVRQPGTRGRRARRRAACIVGHPSADGSICRSFVLVVAPRGPISPATPVRTRVLGLSRCIAQAEPSADSGR